jgi:transposase
MARDLGHLRIRAGRVVDTGFKLDCLALLDQGHTWQQVMNDKDVSMGALSKWKGKRESGDLIDRRTLGYSANNKIVTPEMTLILQEEVERLPDVSRAGMHRGVGQLFRRKMSIKNLGKTIGKSSFNFHARKFARDKQVQKASREIDLNKVIDFYDKVAELRRKGTTAAHYVFVDEVGVFRVDGQKRTVIARKGRQVVMPFCCNSMRDKVNLLAACTATGVFPAYACHGCNIDSDIFMMWLEADVMPELCKGMVVVMDGASFHPREQLNKLLGTIGVHLLFTPPYCPFFNPIEYLFGRMKVRMRSDMDSYFERLSIGKEKLFFPDQPERKGIIEECWEATPSKDAIWAYNTALIYGRLEVALTDTGTLFLWGEVVDEWEVDSSIVP